MKTRSYILVTPAKNEEHTLPLLAKSVINQSIRPRLWVIVNDNSTDNTEEIINTLTTEHEWIKGITLKNNRENYDPVFGNAITYRVGIQKALAYAKTFNIPFGYLGLVDADFILERTFFEKLIRKFLEDPYLGIVSGGVYILKNGHLVWEKSNPEFPRGSPRLIRSECLFDIGGYPMEPAPDLVAYYLAKLKGWKTLQVINAIGVELRPTGSRGNVVRRYMRQGFVNYYLGMPVHSEILLSLYLALFDNPRKGLGNVLGYLKSALNKNNRRSKKIAVIESVQKDFSLKNMLKKLANLANVNS